MIEVDPEAVLEMLDARDYYERARSGLGAVFELVAQRTLDAIEAAPERYPAHRFAATPGVRRALFLRPPRFPLRVLVSLASWQSSVRSRRRASPTRADVLGHAPSRFHALRVRHRHSGSAS